jgi:nucleosome binding factor SPN SPT16 subunit
MHAADQLGIPPAEVRIRDGIEDVYDAEAEQEERERQLALDENRILFGRAIAQLQRCYEQRVALG